MEGFTYTDIFDTKGIEYLVIIAFLLLIIPFWRALNAPLVRKVPVYLREGVLTEKVLRFLPGLFYGRNHTWLKLEDSGIARVGLDDLLVHLTGEVNIKQIRIPGEQVRKNDVLAEIGTDGKKLKILSPVSGQVEKLNKKIERDPGILNKDPYGDGWMVMIKPSSWFSESRSFFMGKNAVDWATGELSRIRDFLSNTSGSITAGHPVAVLQTGGEIRDEPLRELPAEIWEKFQETFLDGTG